MAKTQQTKPWWLEEGLDVCPACGQAYAYQTEFRCETCDVVVCSICVDESFAVTFVCSPCCEEED